MREKLAEWLYYDGWVSISGGEIPKWEDRLEVEREHFRGRADQQIVIFKEWGDEECPHYSAFASNAGIPASKRMCAICWKSLEAKDE